MSSTMLQIMQQAMTEMGLTAPSSVIGTTNIDVVQTLALLNASGYELLREFEWQALNTEYRFNTVFYQYTGNTTFGSTSITGMSSIVGLNSNFSISGTGINQDTYVVSAGGSTVVISQAASSTNTGTSLTFGQTKYQLPSDFDRQINRTHFDKSKRWEMLGPETAQQWQWLKSSYLSTGPRIRYRIQGNYFQIWPIVSTADYLGFEYISNKWVTSTSSTTGPDKSSFTSDTDTCIFPDRLMVLATKRKYFQIKGFDTTSLDYDYQRHLSISKSVDGGAPSLAYAPSVADVLITWNNIPDSGYGS